MRRNLLLYASWTALRGAAGVPHQYRAVRSLPSTRTAAGCPRRFLSVPRAQSDVGTVYHQNEIMKGIHKGRGWDGNKDFTGARRRSSPEHCGESASGETAGCTRTNDASYGPKLSNYLLRASTSCCRRQHGDSM
ncbi:hypothetical protein EXIGLDRAFT_358129 [Exidia glandulosa HHB12029]|uniref:Uncharacterized protein n=1 Tax=Exidia glandulosa HHB12029 TaxID=1314781 RepID=A0A165LBL9_EXIGL|nr:hypothetical protein EXIGLDRAFT_358129 [Exidia glandulosa HHB12029]